MKEAVITGLGVVSSIGHNQKEVLENLKQGKSGIAFNQEFEEMGLKSNVSGKIAIDLKDHIDRKNLRFMGDAAAFTYIAMQEAIKDANLNQNLISNEQTGIVVGSGGASPKNQVEAADILRAKGVRKIGPYMVPRAMGSTTSACLSTAYKIKGVNYSISSACATSSHCIGHGAELVQFGKQKIVFAGGGEEIHWSLSALFDAMGALSTKYNYNPKVASRAYDANRDGFVISGGGGIVVIEEQEHAIARGAPIYAKISGYGATSDGLDMVAPSGEGAIRAMNMALKNVNMNNIDYINTHGTSTKAGDVTELNAIKKVFNQSCPSVSSTKSMTGHAQGATGVHETIYSLLMMKNNFIAPSINIEQLDQEIKDIHVVTKNTVKNLNNVLTNSFGFGGTNASILLSKI